MNLKYISILTIVVCLLSFACDHTDDKAGSLITIEISTDDEYPVDPFPPSGSDNTYLLFAEAGSFKELKIEHDGKIISDSSTLTIPVDLSVAISLFGGDLTESLLNPNGYRVVTRFGLEGGNIQANHTNQTAILVTPENDTLYAVYGEGIVYSGTDQFENISGLFFEESTYRIEKNSSGLSEITQISCKYELQVDF